MVEVKLRICVSGYKLGSVLGTGGGTIRTIRRESGAVIHVSPGTTVERVVSVSGYREGVRQAVDMILERLEEEGLREWEGSPEVTDP